MKDAGARATGGFCSLRQRPGGEHVAGGCLPDEEDLSLNRGLCDRRANGRGFCRHPDRAESSPDSDPDLTDRRRHAHPTVDAASP